MADRSQWYRWYALGCIALVMAPMTLVIFRIATSIDLDLYAKYPAALLMDIAMVGLFGFLAWILRTNWDRFTLPPRASDSGVWTVYYSIEFPLSVLLLSVFALIVTGALMSSTVDLASYLVIGKTLTRSTRGGLPFHLVSVLLYVWLATIIYRWWRGFLRKYTGGEPEPPKVQPEDDMYLLPGLKREG